MRCEWNGVSFDLIDTGGIDLADEAELARDVQRQASEAMERSRSGADGGRREGGPAGRRRRAGRNAASGRRPRCWSPRTRSTVPRAPTWPRSSTGSASVSPRRSRPPTVSAPGTCSTASSPASAPPPPEPRSDGAAPRLAIIGRPNVGKSSLLNALLGAERVIVSEKAGTTRDAIDTEVAYEGRPAVLVDTAGLRRRSKVAGTVDYYAQLRSERAVESADVAIVVCDASEGVTAEDLRIAEMAMRSGCATLIVLNKWDITSDGHRGRQGTGRPQAAPAPRGRHLLRPQRARRGWPARPGPRPRGPRRDPLPHPGAEPPGRRRSPPRPRRRRSGGGGCASTTRPRSATARRGSRSRSTTGA